jgi:hypothetical protein
MARYKLILVILFLMSGTNYAITAQTPKLVEDGKVVPRTTIVDFRMIADPTATQHSQYWSRELAKHGYSVQIRSLQFSEDPSVTEKMSGRTRVVKLVGGLDRRGHLIFPRRQFNKNQVNDLVEWLRELKSFGAQGSPEEKPVWGLSQTQFEGIFEALAKPVETDLAGKTLEECLAAIPAPENLPYRWSLEATETRKKQTRELKFPEWQRTEGMAQGAAVSIILRHFGYGFWPARTPKGSIELAIEPIEGGKKLWPLGWELKESPDFVFGKFLKITEVNLTQAPLLDVAQAISVQTDTPVVFDTYNIRKVGIKLEETKIDHPRRKRNWSLVLTAALSQHKMTHDMRVDEAGRGFSLVKPRDAILNALERK